MSHPDDELLSALLDGEAPPGDAAHVDECGDCQSRLAELRFASEVVARNIPLPPGHLREASLAVAQRVADQPVRSLPTIRRWNSGLSAAAVLVVALAVGGLLITQLGRNGTNDSTSSTNDLSVAAGMGTTGAADRKSGAAELESGAGAASDAFGDASLSAPADSTMAATATTELGEVNDIDAVSKRSTADLAARDAGPEVTIPAEQLPCPPDAPDEPVVWQASLTYQGNAAVATVRQRSATTRVTEIRVREGCALLATQAFEPTSPR